MPVTRRDFLKNTSLATAGTVLGPGLFGNPFVRSAMADTIGDRYLVVLFLDGGNNLFISKFFIVIVAFAGVLVGWVNELINSVDNALM